MPDSDLSANHYATIAAAIEYLAAHYQDQPSLDDVAAIAGLSPFHFQRVFKRWAGISPKRFAQYLTLGHAKRLLSEHHAVLDTALDVGLSGPSRLHDLFIACEAMTPGEYKACGEGLTIRWGFHDSPFGRALIASTERGVCWFSFVVAGDEVRAFQAFAEEWSLARLVEDPSATAAAAARAFEPLDEPARPLHLLLRGTNFQIKVWEALLRIPLGQVVSYQDIAAAIGQPQAVRAVGHAIGRNPISLIIPCHRVILKSGVVHNYRWEPSRKRALLAWETACRETANRDAGYHDAAYPETARPETALPEAGQSLKL
ncbi:MAG: methylated-DNA--[protein]-cysteine S-methyltransferase [Azospirillum sp.]|nr:methylated-DNA--[protein]-cysteine S-methyltransferase [Azospirillum sp.]